MSWQYQNCDKFTTFLLFYQQNHLFFSSKAKKITHFNKNKYTICCICLCMSCIAEHRWQYFFFWHSKAVAINVKK